MRIPPFSRYRPLMRMTAVFVLGMIAGCVVYNGVFHLSYNALWLNNQELQLQLHQNEEDIKTLKNTVNAKPLSRKSRCAQKNLIKVRTKLL